MSDMDEPTAWEDINPVAKLESSALVAASSRGAVEVRLADIYDLEPVDRGEFYGEIAPCLTLAAGVGMSQPDQDAWFEAAFIALEGVPIGLLHRGVRAAMLKADHPSKIIPAITAEIGDSWAWRKANRSAPIPPQLAPIPPARRIETPMTANEAEEMNGIMGRIGLTTRYRPDGTRFYADTPAQKTEARGPLRKPTRADYLAMGVDPAILDQIESPQEGDRP